MLHSLPVFAANIKQWMKCDPVFSRVRNMNQEDWQFTNNSNDADFKPYERIELSMHQCKLEQMSIMLGHTYGNNF